MLHPGTSPSSTLGLAPRCVSTVAPACSCALGALSRSGFAATATAVSATAHPHVRAWRAIPRSVKRLDATNAAVADARHTRLACFFSLGMWLRFEASSYTYELRAAKVLDFRPASAATHAVSQSLKLLRLSS